MKDLTASQFFYKVSWYHTICGSFIGFKAVFIPLMSEIELKGGVVMNYSIKKMSEFVITGYGKHFEGSPDDRYGQQHDSMVEGSMRFVCYALQGMAKGCETEYCVVTSIDDKGFDFTIGTVIHKYFRIHLHKTLGDYDKLLKSFIIPKHAYVSAEIERRALYFNKHLDLRRRVVCEWLLESGMLKPMLWR